MNPAEHATNSRPSVTRNWIGFALFAGIAVVLFFVLNTSIGLMPPLGKFLNPFGGFWVNDRSADEILLDTSIPGLRDTVRVVWDDRRVPHIFARDTHDLYLAQGFVTARDRLWQMEFQMRAAAGRLSEIIGETAVEYDRFQRRIGMVYGAERRLASVLSHPESREAIEAYTMGVNAWIDRLDPEDYPVEYKILDYGPEPWSTFHGALLLMYFSFDLTFDSSDFAVTRALVELGEATCNKIYPFTPPFLDPVVPAGTPWNFEPRTIEAPNTGYRSGDTKDASSRFRDRIKGSNSWAVAGSKTKNGYPILCNDIHLALTLPSIWYEVQLAAPGVNVYGVTAPGAPGVIFGFNQHAAWGITSAQSDVIDWYDIEFKDASRRGYRHGEVWRSTMLREERIDVRGGETVIDTIIFTHHGPVVYRTDEKRFDEEVPPGRAMRWAALEPSNEVLALLRLNRAEHYDQFVAAIDSFKCPTLNFTWADRHGDIAVWHVGRFPIRWRGQGRTILDGSDPAHDWHGWVPEDHLPHVKNPPREFVSSANQIAADGSYPYYLGWDYSGVDRTVRINESLSSREGITPAAMIELQHDVFNVHARSVLPVLLRLVDTGNLTPEQKRTYDEVSSWDLWHTNDSIAARIFTYWWWRLYHATWDDEIANGDGSLHWPSRDVTKALVINEPHSVFFDNKDTKPVEALGDVVNASFREAHAELTSDFGPIGPEWTVGKSRGTDIGHLGRIPGLGRTRLETGGTSATVNSTQRTFGPTWRLVVSLGPEVKGWGIYAGGQSGSPGAAGYDSFIDDWVKGRVHELVFLESPDQVSDKVIGQSILNGTK